MPFPYPVDKPSFDSLVLPFGLAERRIYAGPWRSRPPHCTGVKLTADELGMAHWFLPIRDFSVPKNLLETNRIVLEVLEKLATNPVRPLYVGCVGGLGRTGLFLSLLAKTLGVSNPVEYVRQHYNACAVETKEQELYVANYEVPYGLLQGWCLKGSAMWRGLAPACDDVGFGA